jgi:L-ribulose-5-phosphate 4-epimerase
MNRSLQERREEVYRANLELDGAGLVTGTFGNVSGVHRESGILLIKPSGIPYSELEPADIVSVSLDTGEPVDGKLRPSSDTPTHLELYRAFPCGGVAHSHSEAATTLAQARLPVRCTGTTHADYFRGDVPVTREMTSEEIGGAYERNTGLVMVETFREHEIDPMDIPAVLVANHGPFTWGNDPLEAVNHSVILEQVARMECTLRCFSGSEARPAPDLVEKHFLRKHGREAYYGQR